MDERLAALLKELERFGAENDARAQDRKAKMLNVTPETGVFLSILDQATRARRILEIGTSNGYSTLWLADATRRVAGTVTTLEVLPTKAELARANFDRAGLSEWIDLHLIDAGEFLRSAADNSFDFIFLDSDRARYVTWWPDLQRILAPGSLIVMDNVVSHAAEVESFLAVVRETPGYRTVLAPLGQGEQLIMKRLP